MKNFIMKISNCAKCKRVIQECEATWDDMCQECWEAHCSEEWWRLNVWQNGAHYED